MFDLATFSIKVKAAALRLQTLCRTGDPTEEQVKQAVRSVELPVTFENDSFVIDPIRNTVVILAYQVPIRRDLSMDDVIRIAHEWYVKDRPQMETDPLNDVPDGRSSYHPN